MSDSQLFTPITLRGTEISNRAWMAPMCQYSADVEGPLVGAPNDWHVAHYGARAVGGPGAIIVEATGVLPEGRITGWDLGIWDDAQLPGHRRLTAAMEAQGVVPGIQLAHAGRKASTARPWDGGSGLTEGPGAWQVVAPSAVAFTEGYPEPVALDEAGIARVVQGFVDAARRALEAGYRLVELHAAHGYLLHQFLSPVSNRRTDGYGGSLDNRIRLAVEVAEAVRAVLPDDVPLLARVSATDWLEPEGWTADDTVVLAKALGEVGVDALHVSTGGNVATASIPIGPGYQVRFARKVREEAGLPTIAVGMITEPLQAEQLLADGAADVVALARPLLADPMWVRRAAVALRADAPLPEQYSRAAALL
ncbi:NADH:flavin oxidoreductase/NADH oxidase [Nocardioides sp. GY 10127]|uniref:NADH:flavin oxidoreductase/NADH oxidase n=1 Tax=Nocardioides sp. GY 10127 TaxID=2569762 RepID=UPI0010A7CB12|nr:NADH:flavin oxidoreductase/NADH oxidase [Nocardioides sp. GY 10127]TIC82705.1 NADH:flavin oxidoreductase/NADH oxidase [Nocardioides sp. GY 10127]